MKTHLMRQHMLADDQTEEINIAITNWQEMTHANRKAFIDSMNVHTVQAWLNVRAEKFTASKAAEFLTSPISKADKDAGFIGESAKTLCDAVCAEKHGWREEQNPYMEYASIRRGLVFEDVARKKAEEQLGVKIHQVGFGEKDGLFGCSPDGLILDEENTKILTEALADGKESVEIPNIKSLVEIKCPEPKAFYKMKRDAATKDYQKQMQFAMWVANCPSAYFILYCPEVSENICILKYTRGMKYQKEIADRAVVMRKFVETQMLAKDDGIIEIETVE